GNFMNGRRVLRGTEIRFRTLLARSAQMLQRILSVAILVALACPSVAQATSIAPPSLPELIGHSDAVVAGDIVDIEPERLELNIPLYKRPSPNKVKFAVATIRPSERLFGFPQGDTTRIAFVPADQQPTDGLSLDTPVLKVGEKRLLYLSRDR